MTVETVPVLAPGEPWPATAPGVTAAEALGIGVLIGLHVAASLILTLALRIGA